MIQKIIFLFLATSIPYYQQRAPYNINSTVVNLSKETDQSGANKFCNSTNGTAQFTCSFRATKVLTIYTKGMLITLLTDVTCTSCTINIDTLGPIGIKDSLTGLNDAAVSAKQPHLIFYDGVVFRLII
jgi:hypothetical protein